MSTYRKMLQLRGLLRAAQAAEETCLSFPASDRGITETLEMAETLADQIIDEVEVLEKPFARQPEEAAA